MDSRSGRDSESDWEYVVACWVERHTWLVLFDSATTTRQALSALKRSAMRTQHELTADERVRLKRQIDRLERELGDGT